MNCTRCGKVWVPGEATMCSKCAADTGAPPPAGGTPAPEAATPGVVGRMIPTRNRPALVGYYCAFAACLPYAGPVFAVAAIVLGVMGVRLAQRHPEVRGGLHALFAIVGGIGFGLFSLWITPQLADKLAGRF
jgi:hypothetical protein